MLLDHPERDAARWTVHRTRYCLRRPDAKPRAVGTEALTPVKQPSQLNFKRTPHSGEPRKRLLGHSSEAEAGDDETSENDAATAQDFTPTASSAERPMRRARLVAEAALHDIIESEEARGGAATAEAPALVVPGSMLSGLASILSQAATAGELAGEAGEAAAGEASAGPAASPGGSGVL